MPVPAQPLLDLRSLALRPAVAGGVIHSDAPLFEQLLQLAVAHAVLAVSSYGPEDDLALEVPTLEVVNALAAVTTLCTRSSDQAKFATEPSFRSEDIKTIQPLAHGHRSASGAKS